MVFMEKGRIIAEKEDIIIVLDPEKDIHATDFTDNKIVHQLELKQVMQIVKNLIEAGENYNPEEKFLRTHNTITLSGTRGSGKTSFLYSLLKKIETEENILTLKIVDPTLMEEKGHIFLNLVARIKEIIDENIDSNIKPNCEELDKWNSCLNNLAAGLPMLDGINGGVDPSDWNDTTFVMRDGLRRVTGANNLELFFHKYVKLSLELLNKKYLFIAFDDVDTDFAKGWPVLETLRKYLTSPQILTFLSGDLDLYSFLVRKKQWKNFGKTLLKNEYDKGDIYINEYPELVERLESQYMLKLLKPEYRVTLSTLASKLASNDIKIYLNEKGDENEISRKYASYLKTAWGINGNTMKNNYVKFFTSLPIRSQLSLLNTFISNELDKKGSKKPINEMLHQITKGVSDIFYSELRTANVDIWEMINGYGLINVYLLKFLIDNKILDEASQFFPKLNNPSLDGAVVAMGAVLSERISLEPFEIFDHIIRVSNIVSKADKWPLESKDKSPNIKDFIAHSRCLFDYGLRKTASLQSSYIISFENVPKNEGLIPIKPLQEIAKGKKDEDDLRLDEIFDNKLQTSIGFLPALGIQSQLGINESFYSFFNIIAAIGNMILEKGEENMQDEFFRIAQFREFPLFLNTNQHFFKEENEIVTQEEGPKSSKKENKEIKDFITEINSWKKKWDTQMIIPPYLLGRIMVRTMYTFSNIDIKPNMRVGELLHRQIIVFLNAILVEEVMENAGNSQLRLTNPINSDKNFMDNFRNNRDNHPLFDFIFSCPLMQSYINPELFEELRIGWKPETNIYSHLLRMNIKGIGDVKSKISKINRTIKDTEEDTNILIKYFKDRKIGKTIVDFDRVKKAIQRLFVNKRVATEMVNKHLSRIQNSNQW